MSGISIFATFGVAVFLALAVRDAVRGSWFGLLGLMVAGAGFALFMLASDAFFGLLGLAVFVVAFHYAGLVVILGPVLGAIIFILDRPARRTW